MNNKRDEIYAEYAKHYDIESLATPNDLANLETFINNQVIISNMQIAMADLASKDAASNALEIQKINVALRDLITGNLAIERALGIDRKSRTASQKEDVATYIVDLKKAAREWLDNKFIKVMCPHCKVMVGRYAPVHEHTAFKLEIQCSQCERWITVNRKERDVFFDVKKADWRRKHPVEINHPKEDRRLINDEEPELFIGNEDLPAPVDEEEEDYDAIT